MLSFLREFLQDETTILTRKHHPKHLKNCLQVFSLFVLMVLVSDVFSCLYCCLEIKLGWTLMLLRLLDELLNESIGYMSVFVAISCY